MSNTRVHPLSWLLSNNRLEKAPFVSVPHTSSNRLLLSNQDKGCTPSVAHSLALALGPALLNLWTVSLTWCFSKRCLFRIASRPETLGLNTDCNGHSPITSANILIFRQQWSFILKWRRTPMEIGFLGLSCPWHTMFSFMNLLLLNFLYSISILKWCSLVFMCFWYAR